MTNDDNTTPDPEVQPEDDGGLHAAPADVAEDAATGYAVFNRTLGQYVQGVHADKPSKAKADKAVPSGHVAAVVRV